jgi:hypothetical protein
MIDEKVLDRMSFGELSRALEYVLETIRKLEDELPEGEDDPRLDMLYVLGNKIIMRMDSIVRESGSPEALAQWNQAKDGYEEQFEKYADILLEDDDLLDFE